MAVLMFSLKYKKELRDKWHKIWYALAMDVTDLMQMHGTISWNLASVLQSFASESLFMNSGVAFVT